MSIEKAITGNGASVFRKKFGVPYPIVQGPMNGASPVKLVVAVCEAGGLGCLAASLLTPEAILERQMRHHLCKYEHALMHDDLLRRRAKGPKSELRRSNRDQISLLVSPYQSSTYFRSS